MTKRGRSKIQKKVLAEISKGAISLFLIFLGYLSYIVEIRQSLGSNYGIYFVGLIDGIVLTTTLIVFVTYTVSVLLNKKL